MGFVSSRSPLERAAGCSHATSKGKKPPQDLWAGAIHGAGEADGHLSNSKGLLWGRFGAGREQS